MVEPINRDKATVHKVLATAQMRGTIALDYNETDGKWYKENIIVERLGTGFKVVVWDKDEPIECAVPSVMSLINFLTRLFNGTPPTFKTSNHIIPTKTGLIGNTDEKRTIRQPQDK